MKFKGQDMIEQYYNDAFSFKGDPQFLSLSAKTIKSIESSFGYQLWVAKQRVKEACEKVKNIMIKQNRQN